MRRIAMIACALLMPPWMAARNPDPVVPPAKLEIPEVHVQAIPERDTIHRGDKLTIVLVLNNASSLAVQDLQVSLVPESDQFRGTASTPRSLPAGSATDGGFTITALDKAEFGKHKLTLVARYAWGEGVGRHTASQALPIDFQVDRQFEEEAKALPGGSSAMLYLILPIVTIFLSYSMLESLRARRGFEVPEFKAAYIAPAFLVAILLHVVMLAQIKRDESFIYADPRRFANTLLICAGVGAVVPAARGILQLIQWWRTAFSTGDGLVDYLEKVLRDHKDGLVDWTTLTAGAVAWNGVLLEQPNHAVVLGARLQVSPNDRAKDLPTLKQAVSDGGTVLDSKKLIRLARHGRVKLSLLEAIQQGGKQLEQAVALPGPEAVAVTAQEKKPLLFPVE